MSIAIYGCFRGYSGRKSEKSGHQAAALFIASDLMGTKKKPPAGVIRKTPAGGHLNKRRVNTASLLASAPVAVVSPYACQNALSRCPPDSQTHVESFGALLHPERASARV